MSRRLAPVLALVRMVDLAMGRVASYVLLVDGCVIFGGS